MALQWNPDEDFKNGQPLGEIRENINNFNESVVSEVSNNTTIINSNTTRIGTLEGDSHTHSNKALLDSLTDAGAGDKALFDDGQYKAILQSVVWGDIGGVLSNQTDLQAALDAKANSGHSHQISDITGLQSELDGKADDGDSYLKTEHIVSSGGGSDAGKPIITDGTGKIHTSLVPVSGFYPVGNFTPTSGTEYPDTTGHTPGAIWTVAGVDAVNGYTFTGGDLSGQTAYNGDSMILGDTGWILKSGSIHPEDYYRVDGTNAITAPFAGGGQQIKNIAAGTEAGDAVEYSQIASFATDFVPRDGSLALTGDLDGGGFQLSNIGDGVDSTDAATKAQVDTVQSNLDTHATATDNPHGVSPAQIGAATQADLDSHTGSTSNPHSVSAAQVGALTPDGDGSQLTGITASQVGAAPTHQENSSGTALGNIVIMTQAEYDALTPNENTVYVIKA